MMGWFRPAADRIADHKRKAEQYEISEDWDYAMDHYRRAAWISKKPEDKEVYEAHMERCRTELVLQQIKMARTDGPDPH
jgi:hypothetical protein